MKYDLGPDEYTNILNIITLPGAFTFIFGIFADTVQMPFFQNRSRKAFLMLAGIFQMIFLIVVLFFNDSKNLKMIFAIN